MRKLVAPIALISGILFFLVPRYILPACEYAGFSRMHCSDTAEAEYIVGALLIVVGGAAFFLRSARAVIISSAIAATAYGIAIWLPGWTGYCMSPRMPCNYGMVPGIRFLAAAGFIFMVIALIRELRSARMKGNP